MNSHMLIGSRDPKANLPLTPVRALGIDLGTTNSTVAEVVWDPADPSKTVARCLEVDQDTLEGRSTHVLVPSVVALHEGKRFVGEGAKRLRARAAELGLNRYEKLFFECKNEMGIQRSYPRAQEGLRSAAEIGGVVLKYLNDSALADDPTPSSRVVVTVPASFQAVQRADTQRAAELAGLRVEDGDLLDEPVAAFLDYLATHRDTLLPELASPRKLVVFDFGGGTCDVAVLGLEGASAAGGLKVASLAVSRYHRLGGGDIDAAILFEVLLPQLLEQNGLPKFALGYHDKRDYVVPALLSVAESLKVGISTEIARLEKFGKYEGADREQVVKTAPGEHRCPIRGKMYTLQSPRLTAAQFEKLLEPFLERDLLVPRQTDYRVTCSIFAPLQDALERAGLSPQDIDYCLLVGGSSLIPQVARAVAAYFLKAQVLTYPDLESCQTAVARGAAYHALALAMHGSGLVQPVCHDVIGIRTSSGPIELIPSGSPLPFPADGGYLSANGLVAPAVAEVGSLDLRVEIVAGSGAEEAVLFSDLWNIPAPVQQGDPLRLEYRYDANQLLHLELSFADGERRDRFSKTLEKPLTNVVNPDARWAEIHRLEEELRTGKVPRADLSKRLVELAEHYSGVGQREASLESLKRALRARNEADVLILNKMADCAGELGDFESEEKFYREAGQADPWSGSWFNLALALKRRGLIGEAVEAIEKALTMDPESPYMVLRAMLAESLGDQQQRTRFLNQALAGFDPLGAMNDWELHWFLKAARMDMDEDAVKRALEEQRRRQKENRLAPVQEGLLPALVEGKRGNE